MQYLNQFLSVPESERCRTTVELPRKIESQIKKYESKIGVLQITTSMLLTKLSDELYKSNITDGDRFSYQHALADAVLVLPDRYYDKPDAGTSSDTIQRGATSKPAKRPKRDSSVKADSGDDR